MAKAAARATAKQSSKTRIVRNPTGKGGFQERPQDINKKGSSPRGQSWKDVIKRLSDMTRDEAVEYVGGSKTKLGRLLGELPPGIPIKDALILASFIAYGREPNARMLQAIMDREDGKPSQPIEGGDPDKPILWKEFISGGDNPDTDTSGG